MARKLGCTLVLDATHKRRPISVANAAMLIVQSTDHDAKVWKAKRNALYNFNKNAGQDPTPEAIVASYLVGPLGKGCA